MSIQRTQPFVERDRGADERHGTTTGARRHSLAGEPPCDACRAAKSEYDRRRLAAPELTRRNRLHAKAQQAAYRALAKEHPERYRALYLAYKEQFLKETAAFAAERQDTDG